MLFKFLKYIQPVWFPNLDSKMFIHYSDFTPAIKKLVSIDPLYESQEASIADAAYQAWHKGLIAENNKNAFFQNNWPLEDEYRFVRKYFSAFWSYYILIFRLLTFKNPGKEIKAFSKSKNTKRIDMYRQVLDYPDYNDFVSPIAESTPLISVIIPTLNRYAYLNDVLKDLEKQDFQNIEVLIVDQSKPFHKEFYEGFRLNIQLIKQEDKALWKARNRSIKLAKGDYILLFDDDSRVESDWIIQHIKCLDYFKADISSGVSLSTVGAKIPENYSFFRWADQLDTGNVMIKKEVFRSTGLFDKQFEKQRMGDGEFGTRCYLAGFKNISNPLAKRIHLKAGSGGLRQLGSWDAYRPSKLFAPRPIPSILYYFIRYFGKTNTYLALLKNVPPSIVPYKFKKNKFFLFAGASVSILLLPIVSMQVGYSWHLAQKKIKEGPKIDTIE